MPDIFDTLDVAGPAAATVPAPLGKVTDYGQANDPNRDSASLGTGKYKVPTGAWDNPLTPSSLAVSPDIAAQFRKAGIAPKEPVKLLLADGTSTVRTYDDHTATDAQARAMRLPQCGHQNPYASARRIDGE